ncbi:hypothetical protein [Mycolicibacterium rhodesiae]|uniref:MalT-like TPR region domain-containing protein n=1 Tax=Mycolicibacterium rhodesiae TaxID=36814 RepID=A0A1X0IL37_MYCRH|nr:hypothetical protein [Mycolicibacterium rhodesiae]MCV7348510.1 hypothetical protein [Mycolicibacterium rhodesiae]ORB48499.1 hypothetical protein BST42_25440 [Mycolicibacterium rhodesiae]
MDASVLTAAAFGDHPGCWPLPTAHTPEQLWHRAVAAAGQGRYSSARADLAVLRRREPAGAFLALSLSTEASLLRQLGGHRSAAGWDGRALALAQTCGDHPLSVQAHADAVVGLAADALGVGRLAASARLLQRAGELTHGSGVPRLAIRLEWVRAELAMAGGRGEEAVTHARRGIEIAEQASPALRRHRVKSDVVLAAALCCAGALEPARAVADAALRDTEAYGLVPLRWALACLLIDIGSASLTSQQVSAIRDDCAGLITRRGGRWSPG